MLFAEPSKGPYVLKPGGEAAKKSEYESNTSLSKFFDCPVIYHEWYSRKFREPASKELVFGRAYHLTLDNALTEKAWNGLMMHPTALAQRFEQWLLIEAFYNGKSIEWRGEPGQSMEDFVKLGTELVQLWRHDYLPGLNPKVKGKNILVEAGFWLPLRNCKRALYGKIDLITTDGLLVDHKTSSHPWKDVINGKYHKARKYNGVEFFEEDLQMSIYHAAYEDVVKDWPRSCELHRAITTNAPEIERIVLNYSPEEVQNLFDKVVKPALREVDKMWEAKEFPCRCGNHTNVPATAERPLATVEGHAAGTTEGPVVGSDSLIDKVNRGSARVREEPSVNRVPLPPDQEYIEELPF